MLKKSIANFFTVINLFLGFVAIILVAMSLDHGNLNTNISNNYMIISCLIIFFAALIDVFDGKIARKLGTSSEFGKQIDSLADLVSFCLFPSILLFGFYYNKKYNPAFSDWFIYFCSSFPLIFGAIRLGRYNAYKVQSDSENYIGLPTPSNDANSVPALILASPSYLA